MHALEGSIAFGDYLKKRRPNWGTTGDFVRWALDDQTLPEIASWSDLSAYLNERSAGMSLELGAHLVWRGYLAAKSAEKGCGTRKLASSQQSKPAAEPN